MSTTLDARLLEILACPQDKGPLLYFHDEDGLYNPRLRLRYRIDDGIPVMLIDEADRVDEGEHQRLVARAEAEGMPGASDPGAFDAAAVPDEAAGAGK